MRGLFSPKGTFVLSIITGLFHSLYFLVLTIFVYPRILETYQIAGQEGLVRANAPAYVFTSSTVLFYSLGASLYSFFLKDQKKVGVFSKVMINSIICILLLLIVFTASLFSSILPGLISGKRFF